MGHFGLICPELTGHLNPMTALGRELKRSGHNITLIGRPDAQKKTESAGLEFAVVGEQEFPVGSLAQTTAQLGRLAGLKAIRLTAELLRRAAITILDQASDAIASAGVDALLVDQVTPSRRDGRGDTPFTVCFGLQCTGVKSGSSPAAGSDTVAISSRHHLALAQRARRLHSADSRPPDHSRD
jgi:hypothetical protein